VLLVDDDRDLCETIALGLDAHGIEVAFFTRGEEAFDALRTREFDVALVDLRMPGMPGIELCSRIVESRPDLPVVVITAFGSLESAVAAIRAGAYDFVSKPIEMDMLKLVVERAARHRELERKVRTLGEALDRTSRFEELIGTSPPMLRLFDQLDRVAPSDVSVLVAGESGTGKEVVARALHKRSGRRDGPFVPVNCSALPETLLESELFGHVRGAFTDARADRTGLFVQADGGTLFLDEIAEVPLPLQPKLLRALEARTVRPVGGDAEVGFDVRLVAATNRDLESAVAENRFREDLFYRIDVVRIDLPPLRARGGDVLVLAQHYLETYAARMSKDVRGLSKPVAEKLLAYAWPGNVRELRNAIERAVALTLFDEIGVEDLPERVRDYKSSELRLDDQDPENLPPMSEVERRYIRHVLEATGGNKTLAARILGFDRRTLYRKLAEE
jgi:two-component system response regulator HydG